MHARRAIAAGGGASALLSLAALLLAGVAAAQSATVVFDGSLGDPPGAAPTLPFGGGVDYRVDFCPSCAVSHGELVGSNLFQSFARFDIDAGDAATFSVSEPGAPAIDNVFSRVTAADASEIFGLLRSEIDGADFYLLNPYGVVFGSTAQIDTGGSFYVSTADELRFEGLATGFVARPGGSVPLAMAPPAAFGFFSESVTGASPAEIRFEGSQLAVDPGHSFTAVAGRIAMEGRGDAVDVASVRVSGGRIQLAAASSGSEVPLAIDGLDLASVDVGSAEVALTRNAILDVGDSVSAGAGRIVIRGGRFAMSRPAPGEKSGQLKSFVRRFNGADPTAVDIAVAGDLIVEGAVILSFSDTQASGDLRLAGGNVDIRGGTLLASTTGFDSSADGADIHIGGGAVKVRGGASVRTADEDIDSPMAAGDIQIVADRVEVSGTGSSIVTQTAGSGAAGAVQIEVSDAVALSDGGRIVAQNASGPGGRIDIDAQTLRVVGEDTGIASLNGGAGVGAPIRIGSEAAPLASVVVAGGAITTTTTGAGPGGSLEVHASQITVSTGTELVGSTGQISAVTDAGSSGPGGDVILRADAIDLLEGGQLRTTTEGTGAGGELDILVNGRLLASGVASVLVGGTPEPAPSGIFARSAASGSGPGGEIDLRAETLELANGAEISNRSLSAQDAGPLTIVAGAVSVSGGPDGASTISAASEDGNGGVLTIVTDSLSLQDGGIVRSTTGGTGDSGDVLITAREITIQGVGEDFAESGLFAQSILGGVASGDAGSIVLRPPDGARLSLLVRDGGLISVRSLGGGAAGVIDIRGAERVEIADGGQIRAQVNTVTPQAGVDPRDRASDIRILDTDTLVLSRGTINSVTLGDGFGGSIEIEAANVTIANGSEITAESAGALNDAGDAGSIEILASDRLDVSQGTITTQARQAAGGAITLAGGSSLTLSDGSEVSARAEGDGSAGDIVIRDTGAFTLASGSTLTAETSGAGAGGQVAFTDVDTVILRSGAGITTRSNALGGGDAGSIVIAALKKFDAKNSEITTTAADAGGGRISIQAGKLVSLVDSRLETTVDGSDAVADGNAGNIDIPLVGDEIDGIVPTVPKFVVVNRSTIQANAVATNAGNITIAGNDVLISSDSLIQAKSETGISGEIQITSPDADVASQVTPLPSSFIDPSDRLLPPCIARTERTGSFVVQNRQAPPRSPDAPLGSSLADGRDGPTSDSERCPPFLEVNP